MSSTRFRSSATSSSSASSFNADVSAPLPVSRDLILANSKPLDANVAMDPSDNSTSRTKTPKPTQSPQSHAMSSPMTSSCHQFLVPTGARDMVAVSKRLRFSLSLFWPMS